MLARLQPYRQQIIELIKFILVGCVNTAVGYSIILTLMFAFAWAPVPANVVGFAIGLVVSYFLNKTFTFSERQAAPSSIPRFIAVFAVAYSVNLIVLTSVLRFEIAPAFIAQGLGICAYSGLFFLLCRRFVFRVAPTPSHSA